MALQKACFCLSLRSGTFILLLIIFIGHVYQTISSMDIILDPLEREFLCVYGIADIYQMAMIFYIMGSFISFAALIALIAIPYYFERISSIFPVTSVMVFLVTEIFYTIYMQGFVIASSKFIYPDSKIMLVLKIIVYVAFNIYSLYVFWSYISELKRNVVKECKLVDGPPTSRPDQQNIRYVHADVSPLITNNNMPYALITSSLYYPTLSS